MLFYLNYIYFGKENLKPFNSLCSYGLPEIKTQLVLLPSQSKRAFVCIMFAVAILNGFQLSDLTLSELFYNQNQLTC